MYVETTCVTTIAVECSKLVYVRTKQQRGCDGVTSQLFLHKHTLSCRAPEAIRIVDVVCSCGRWVTSRRQQTLEVCVAVGRRIASLLHRLAPAALVSFTGTPVDYISCDTTTCTSTVQLSTCITYCTIPRSIVFEPRIQGHRHLYGIATCTQMS